MNKHLPEPSDLLKVESAFFEEGDNPPEVETRSEAPVVLEAEAAAEAEAEVERIAPAGLQHPRRQSLRRVVGAVVGVSAVRAPDQRQGAREAHEA